MGISGYRAGPREGTSANGSKRSQEAEANRGDAAPVVGVVGRGSAREARQRAVGVLMAGQPLKRKLIEELERRAALMTDEHGEPCGPLDVIHDWVAAGRTMRDLTIDVGKDVGHKLSASSGILTTWVNSTPEGRAMLAQAREIAAHALAEETLDILEQADEDKNALTKAKLRAENNRWLASKYNRRDYGETPQVQINQYDIGQLHIDAMRQRRLETGDQTPSLSLPPAVEGQDYEVLPPEGEA
jgi:hypothetical protein